MKAAIFIRKNGAGGLGHVGWAFEYTDGNHNAGAVENTPGTPLSHPDDMDFWSVKTTNPTEPMRQRDYDGYKVINLKMGNAAKAWSAVLDVKKQWYTVLFGNCMDDVYKVLTAYGVQLPLPSQHITPNNWFNSLSWEYHGIKSLKNNLNSEPSGDAYDMNVEVKTEVLEADISDLIAADK